MVDEIQLLRRVDPARGVGGSGALDDRARADLQRLLADPGLSLPTAPAPFVPVPLARARTVRRREPVPVATGKRWTARRRSTLAGAATVALVLAVLALSAVLAPGRGGPPPAFAATPPILRAVSTSESAGTVLGHLARVAAAQTATPSDLRRVSYEHWSLANRINGRTVTVAVVPEQVQLSWKPDGSGCLARRRRPDLLPDGGLPRRVGAAGATRGGRHPDQQRGVRPGAVPPGLPVSAPGDLDRACAPTCRRRTPSTATAPVSCSPP